MSDQHVFRKKFRPDRPPEGFSPLPQMRARQRDARRNRRPALLVMLDGVHAGERRRIPAMGTMGTEITRTLAAVEQDRSSQDQTAASGFELG